MKPSRKIHPCPAFSLAGCLAIVTCLLTQLSSAQLSPFPDVDSHVGGGRDLPEILPPDPIDPVINPRQTSADRLARVFNRDLRDLEEAQSDIITELEKLPRATREAQRINAFGYHAGHSKERPKWLQIDLGAVVALDAIALFPVMATFEDEMIFGYGFPRSFRIDISNEEDFRNYNTLVEGRMDVTHSGRRWPYYREFEGFSGRYVRITATELWRSEGKGLEAFALSEIMVLKAGRNLAAGKPVKSRDSEERSDQWSGRFVTDGITTLGIPHGIEESPTLGFRSQSKEPAAESWVQVDLGENTKIDEIQLILADSPVTVPDPTVRFPYPLRVEVSESPDMQTAELVGRFTPAQISLIGTNPVIVPAKDVFGRYVRITVTGPQEPRPLTFDLAEVTVYSGTENVSLGKSVTALHPVVDQQWAPAFLTDGYSSRRNLIGYDDWLSDIDKRNRLVRRWMDKESQRLDLVDQTVTVGMSSIASGLVGVLAFVLVALSRGRVKRRKDLEALRQRIASDLHDDIGSNLSSIALLAELGKTETDEPELVIEELTEIKNTADKTIESMRDIVWLIRPGEETWQQMLTRFRETAAKLLRTHEYTFVVNGEVSDDHLSLEFKRDIFLIYKEVLNNIVRHAAAKHVSIEIDHQRNRLQISIVDDGKGFNNLDQEFREGNGLRNLRMRAQSLGASLKVRSVIDEGTSIQLTIPVP